jgi:nicotinic acid phosphoribosyltransferase
MINYTATYTDHYQLTMSQVYFYKRFNNPHIYKVGLSERLKNERDWLIEVHKK